MAWLHLEQSLFDPAEFDDASREAEEAASRAVLIAPDAPAARVTLGLAYLVNNRLSEAETQVRQALDLAPNDPYAQYYAVAVLALDPANRSTAKQLVQMVRDRNFPTDYVKRLDEVYTWGVVSTVPLQGLRQRPLPPRFVPPPPWPSLSGMPRGTAAATLAQPSGRRVKPDAAQEKKPTVPRAAPDGSPVQTGNAAP
jgi:tetratricopeptide (TPR) repeat protein